MPILPGKVNSVTSSFVVVFPASFLIFRWFPFLKLTAFVSMEGFYICLSSLLQECWVCTVTAGAEWLLGYSLGYHVWRARRMEGTPLPLGGFLASSSRNLPLIVSQNLFCPSCLDETLAKSVGVEKRERWRKSSITTAFPSLAVSVTSCGVSQS